MYDDTDAHTGGTYYFNPVSSTVLSLIPKLFPEGRTPNPALVDPNVDVVVTFNSVRTPYQYIYNVILIIITGLIYEHNVPL